MYEVVILHLGTGIMPKGKKEVLVLNDLGYERCKADRDVKIIAVGLIK